MKIGKKTLTTISILLTVVSIIVLAMKLFFPHHRILAITLYGLSWLPFIYGFATWRTSKKKYERKLRTYIKQHKATLYTLAILLTAAYFIWVIFPVEDTTFLQAEHDTLQQRITEDLALTRIHIQGAQDSVEKIQENAHLFQADFETLSSNDKEELLNLWSTFIDYTIELEKTKEMHKHFYQINYIKYPQLNLNSFLIAYASFVTNYKNSLTVSNIVGENHIVQTILNEERTELSIPANSFFYVKQGLTHPNTLVQLNAGQAHLHIFREVNPEVFAQEQDLIIYTQETYAEIIAGLQQDPRIFIDNPADLFEQKTLKSWFPFQKNIAITLGETRTTSRDYFITHEQLTQLKPELEPGDILFERRNWHMSNIGIPGFWPHSALYTGTLEDMENYFAGLSVDGLSITEYIKRESPRLYEAYTKRDAQGFAQAVIESKAEGVILHSLQESAHADYLAVLRPKISKEKKFAALLEAFKHYKKPYDYNFDFVTDNELVCSELIYKAYEEDLDLNVELTAGRYVLPPTKIIEKFDAEYATENEELSFVAFFDGSEEQQIAIRKDVEEFRTSWQRPKWDIVQE